MTTANEQHTESSTALVTTEAREAATELEAIRQQGVAAVERKKALATLQKLIAGLEWGSVRGSSLSPATQYAIAEVCYVTGANPYLHIDLLGGRCYHNSAYYEDLINQHPHFIGYDQRMITAAVAKRLHEQAAEIDAEARRLISDAETLQVPELRDSATELLREAVQLRAEARARDRARAEYGVPDEAEIAYETILLRYAPDAPLDAIRAGDIDGERFRQEVRECNWIDRSKKDPVGIAHPDKTCRTRSLRRAAKKAFSAWIEPKLREVERFERQIEAEWSIVREDRNGERAQLPAPDGPQAVRIGSGEPSASAANGARPLPVEVETPIQPTQPPAERTNRTTTPAAASSGGVRIVSQTDVTTSEEWLTDPSFDANDARRRYFANLTDAGIGHDAARKAWQQEHGLPASTGTWTPEQWQQALELLVGPARKQFEEGCATLGKDPEQTQQLVLGGPAYRTSDYEACSSWLHAQADAEDADDQRELLQ